jgi:stress response protein YsnF
MAQTVIGFFDNTTDAQRAVERLESIGIPRQDVDLSSGNRGNTGTTNVSSDRNRDSESKNGITRFFESLFGSDNDDAERYSRVGQNCSIVTVHAQSSEQAQRAAELLDDCGAVDVDERAAQQGYASGTREGMGREGVSDRRETSIPRIQEDLEVGKRTEERGGVRVRSRIVERPVEEHVRLREEHVHVEREAVDRPVTDRDMQNFREGEVELRERAEVPVVNKQARVVEEVKVTKDVEHRDETVRDTVRNTEVDVDKLNRNERRDRTDERDTTSGPGI